MRDAQEAKESHRWIIFCQFHDEMELLQSYLESFEFTGSVLQYHGGMDMKQRDEAIEASYTLTGKQDVFLIQLQAGGTGLNLQHYDRIVFVSPWWTSALLEQAKGRAVRIGQENVVKIYWLKLKVEDENVSIDDFIMDKANMKKDMAKEFLSWSHSLPVS
jgi:SNF2 family DNA or RNA helicase